VTAAEWAARAGSAAARRDAETFLAHVARSDFFGHDADIVVARAPGRLDVMGGIADYSGSLVLEWPLADATFVGLQRGANPTLDLVSGTRRASVDLRQLVRLDYETVRAFFAADPATRWSAYVAGAFVVLAHEHRVEFSGGARLLIASTVAEGKGVSSSAALEVAAMMAICAAYDIPIEPRRLALLCQRVENAIVGAPCGVMDQMTALLGESRRLMALLCQPAEVQRHVALPPGFELWGIDSGVRHSVAGEAYVTVHTAAAIGQHIVERLTGCCVEYLANVAPADFARIALAIPERLTGREFLRQYPETIPSPIDVDPAQVYPVRAATAHPVYEHARVCEFVQEFARLEEAQEDPTSDRIAQRAERLGGLMYESHDGYSACGLGCDGTDALVALARRAGVASGIYGARITGAGGGGTVVVLGHANAEPIVHAVAAEYARRFGSPTSLFAGSSAGAATCGVCVLKH
jgi:galactokinase